MTTPAMRRLSLHASALSDDEYDLYTSSIEDLAPCDSNPNDARDDTFYERIAVGVREVRAWLRGRYRDTPVNTIDAVLKFFSPSLSPADTLSGGEFFAVLRLVLHVQSGKPVDRTLVFVQAHPPSTNSSPKNSSSVDPQRHSVDSSARSIASEPPSSVPNPFSGQQPPLHPSQRQDTPKHTHSPNNPFVAHCKSTPTKSENGLSRLPPLPPRKPSAPVPPPRHTSRSSVKSGSSAKSHRTLPTAADHLSLTTQSQSQLHLHSHPPPPPPPKPKPVTHVTSPLIKRSLQASKVAQTIKHVEEERGRERILQVLRSSAGGSGNSARNNDSPSRSPAKKGPASAPLSVEAKSDSSASLSGGDERERPPLPRRPRQPHVHSPSMSASSLEQVAMAGFPSGSRSYPASPFTRSPFESPSHSPRPSLDSPSLPPPTHPNRKPYQPYQPHPSPHHDNRPQSPHSVSTFPSPFDRNLESFEVVYGLNRRSSVSSLETPIAPTATSDTLPEQSKVFRSKSVHQYKPYIPPPPARRKRPESVQVLTNGQAFFGVGPSNDSNNALKNSIAQSPSKPPRRASYSSTFGGSTVSAPATTSLAGGTDAIHRKLAELQLKAENALPKFEAARYKAEAGISRRGFIQGSPSRGGDNRHRSSSRPRREDREGLMSGYDEDLYGDHGGSDGELMERNGLSVDSGDESCLRGRKEGKNGIARELDDLKWPTGEGWKQL